MALLIFGSFAVAAMLVFYTLEDRSRWFVLAFAVASAGAALYGVFIQAWPFAAIEAIWAVVALRRWWRRTHDEIERRQSSLAKGGTAQ